MVDAFRASATISVLVSKGARVVPVASIEAATATKADFRAGERGGAKVADFDFGNSPTELIEADIPPGSTVVLSTTNGTRIIRAAAGAPLILAGTFINARAVARALVERPDLHEVVVVGCGWRGSRASEDESAAGAILHHLTRTGAEPDERARRAIERYLGQSKKSLYKNSAARRLKRLGYWRDLDFCLSEDTVPVVPHLVGGAFVAGICRDIPGGKIAGPSANRKSTKSS